MIIEFWYLLTRLVLFLLKAQAVVLFSLRFLKVIAINFLF